MIFSFLFFFYWQICLLCSHCNCRFIVESIGLFWLLFIYHSLFFYFDFDSGGESERFFAWHFRVVEYMGVLLMYSCGLRCVLHEFGSSRNSRHIFHWRYSTSWCEHCYNLDLWSILNVVHFERILCILSFFIYYFYVFSRFRVKARNPFRFLFLFYKPKRKTCITRSRGFTQVVLTDFYFYFFKGAKWQSTPESFMATSADLQPTQKGLVPRCRSTRQSESSKSRIYVHNVRRRSIPFTRQGYQRQTIFSNFIIIQKMNEFQNNFCNEL